MTPGTRRQLDEASYLAPSRPGSAHPEPVRPGTSRQGTSHPEPVRPAPSRPGTSHPEPARPRAATRWLVAAVVAFALVVTAIVVGIGGHEGWMVPAGPSTIPPGLFGPSATPSVATTTPVADPAPACLAAALDAVGTSGVIGQVRGLASGAVLWDQDSGRLAIPASNQKLLTTLALADAAPGGLATTYSTTVVSGPGQIVLVGGGDPYLASTKDAARLGQPATLADLAAATATALQAAGRGSVSLGFDDTLFAGPSWLPSWTPGYHYEVPAISSLIVDEGLPSPDPASPSPAGAQMRSETPSLDAARVFASQLRARGVEVTAVTPATAPPGADTLASIDSLPLGDIIGVTLLHSDNTAAEVLFRQLSRAAGGDGSFADAGRAVLDWLGRDGGAAPGQVVADGSGLSRDNLVSPAVLAGVITRAAATDRGLEVLARLPVAAATGSLFDRFTDPAAAGGRGWVHAKTGTLAGVGSLTGYTVTTSGRLLAFSLMINDGRGQTNQRNELDKVATAVTTATC